MSEQNILDVKIGKHTLLFSYSKIKKEKYDQLINGIEFHLETLKIFLNNKDSLKELITSFNANLYAKFFFLITDYNSFPEMYKELGIKNINSNKQKWNDQIVNLNNNNFVRNLNNSITILLDYFVGLARTN